MTPPSFAKLGYGGGRSPDVSRSLYEHLVAAPCGLKIAELHRRVYNGGPGRTRTSMAVAIQRLDRRLWRHGFCIARIMHNHAYRIVPLEPPGRSVVSFLVAAAMWVALCPLNAPAASAADVGQIPPGQSQRTLDWFKNARSPRGGGVHCCDLADGHIVPYRADEQGHYFVTIEGAEYPVPQDALVPPPYVLLEGVVWYRLDNGLPYIRCFAPGGGL
jgi:hypothetical protein